MTLNSVQHGRHGIVDDAQHALAHDEGGGGFVPITSVQLG